MSDPSVILETPIYHVNLTVLLSIVAISLTAMGTIVAIFKKKPKDDENPGRNPACIQHKEDLGKLEVSGKETEIKLEKSKEEFTKKIDALKDLLNETSKEVIILTGQVENANRNIDETKEAVKSVTNKLDDLLKQLLEWMAE